MHTKQKLPVVEILRYRVGTDGTGIRTLIIVEGCPLRCRHCINPETWDGTETIKEYSLEELYDEIKIDDIYFQATNGGITFGGGEPVLYAEFIANFINGSRIFSRCSSSYCFIFYGCHLVNYSRYFPILRCIFFSFNFLRVINTFIY